MTAVTSGGTESVGPGLVALWSVPRSRSTAFLRMMIQRGDVAVVHEPFSHVADFGEAIIGTRTVRSHEAAMLTLRWLASRAAVFFKDTTEHRYGPVLADEGFLRVARHAFLIRDPLAVIASHYSLDPRGAFHRVGYDRLFELHARVVDVCGGETFIFDSDDLVEDPPAVVGEFCRWAGLPYVPGALSWPAGDQAVWQKSRAWHSDVIASTGFCRHDRTAMVDVAGAPGLSDLYRYHLPYYERLRSLAVAPARPGMRAAMG